MAADLDAMLARIRALGSLDELAAREAAPLVEKAAKASAAAGVDPTTGAPWAPLKTGGRAGADAARDVSTYVSGNVVQVLLTGSHVHLHFGRGKEQVPRRVIPTPGAPIPATCAEAMREGARRAIAKLWGSK